MTSQENPATICPESTIESANRRNFIKKAAAGTTAVVLAGTLVGKAVIPESSASSDYEYCVLSVKCEIYIAKCNPSRGKLCVTGSVCVSEYLSVAGDAIIGCGSVTVSNSVSASSFCGKGVYSGNGVTGKSYGSGSGVLGEAVCYTVCEGTPCCPHLVTVGGCGPGVTGTSISGAGVSGCSCSGTGVVGSGSKGVVGSGEFGVVGQGCIGVVAEGGTLYPGLCSSAANARIAKFSNSLASCKVGDRSALIQFQNACSTPVDWNIGVAGKCSSVKVPSGNFYVHRCTCTAPVVTMNKCGLGIGTLNPTSSLDVIGAATVVAGAACTVPLVTKGASGQKANLQQWESSSGSVFAVINSAGSLGLGGVTNPHHVLCISGKAHASSGFSIGPCTCINTTLAVNGSFAAKTRTVGSTTTLLTTDYAILATGTITLTLPPAKTQNGMTIFIKNTSTGTISVAPGGTDSIEGSSTARTLTKQYDSLQLISNGSNEWYILSGAKCGAFVS